MPSYLHEGLVELFRSQPMLAAWYLAHVFGEHVPDCRIARAEPCDFTDIGPKEFRGDSAIALYGPDDKAIVGIDVEVQLGIDETRRWQWPVYLSTLRSRLRCPTYLLVVAPAPDVAEWCRKPIDLGHPGFVLRPLVLGPDRIPVITDPAVAVATPELAVLSAIAHGDDPQRDQVFDALLAGLHETTDEQARMYYDVVLTALPAASRHRLEEMMATREYQSDFARMYVAQGRSEGHTQGLAEGRTEEAVSALLRVLRARRMAVTQDARDRIAACGDPDRIEDWIERAVTAKSLDEVFDE
ncbi:hypothetical protein BJY24_000475 [Nocardia transvalensis]|uniref:Uncharacterized protein n=1 Tax=Nocardia transvalensis TaxID=37333 RepID=A0A7W9P9D8_9NOCA|nr:hypothetical protein [Nocardia transvalensis]MBB5911608.1 hypothetical protein [Nocardia transvalensis]